MNESIHDAFLSTLNLSKDHLHHLRYFGITHAITAPLPGYSSSSETLIHHFRAVIEEANRLRLYGIQARPILGIWGTLPPRAGKTIYAQLEHLLRTFELPALGPIGIKKDDPESWKTFETQVRLAMKLELPIVIAAPPDREATYSHLMVESLNTLRFPLSKSLFITQLLSTTKILIEEGAYCGLTPASASKLTVDEFQTWFENPTYYHKLLASSGLQNAQDDVLALPKMRDTLQKFGCNSIVKEYLYSRNYRSFFGIE